MVVGVGPLYAFKKFVDNLTQPEDFGWPGGRQAEEHLGQHRVYDL